MLHTAIPRANWPHAPKTNGLPRPLDSEALSLLRLFLTPVLERARNWYELSEQLRAKGFTLTFRQGRFVILNELGEALCTGRDLGVPLARLAKRLGRPRVCANRTGEAGELDLSANPTAGRAEGS